MPPSIPSLVPGQEWRTLWDFTPQRVKTELPDRHEAVANYRDLHQHALAPTPSVLDWSTYRPRMWVTTYGLHDIGKALKEISETTATWQGDLHSGLAVFVHGRAANDEQIKQRHQIGCLWPAPFDRQRSG